LLYHLLKGFASTAANIAISRITTEKGAAIDSFYVMNAEGKKLKNPAAIEKLQKALQAAAESSE